MNFDLSDIPVVILCGGKGTRLRDVTEALPKPMVPIGEFPIVVHIMKWYAKFGIKKFILCLGYKKEAFIDYFSNFAKYTNDITIDLKTNSYQINQSKQLDWQITLCDTGLKSKTGRRINRALKYVNSPKFFMTYGDGVSNVDINLLYESHLLSKKNLTMTQVKSPTRFGLVETDSNGNVLEFKEKNQSDGYINGGFMVIEQEFCEKYLNDDDVFFEQNPMSLALMNKDIHAYTHNDFWQCMDSLKEYELLNNIWKRNIAPWKA